MFYGEHKHSVDRKGRLIIPSKFREVFKEHYAEKFYVTRGLDQCLFMFVESEWRALENKFKNLPFTRKETRKFNRLFFSGATEAGCDSQGRILIPSYLKEYAQLKRDVMIVGVANRIEIWSQDLWSAFYSENKGSFESIAENIWEGEKGQ